MLSIRCCNTTSNLAASNGIELKNGTHMLMHLLQRHDQQRVVSELSEPYAEKMNCF